MFLLLYWLRMEHNIAHPGSHPSLAFLFNSDLLLFTFGTLASLLLCAAVLASGAGGEARHRPSFAQTGLASLGVTLVAGVIALPLAFVAALNLWGS
jgi:hypothetical protein